MNLNILVKVLKVSKVVFIIFRVLITILVTSCWQTICDKNSVHMLVNHMYVQFRYAAFVTCINNNYFGQHFTIFFLFFSGECKRKSPGSITLNDCLHRARSLDNMITFLLLNFHKTLMAIIKLHISSLCLDVKVFSNNTFKVVLL